MGLERSSGVVPTGRVSQPGNGEELARPVKPFGITKRVVWDAYQHVKANQGAEGIDRQSIEMFEANLKDNLYRIWNRMCSGSYFPQPFGWLRYRRRMAACVRLESRQWQIGLLRRL